MGALEDLNLREKEAFTELKTRIANEAGEIKNDVNLYLRFLRARDFNVDLAETMLRTHLSWRKAIQIDSIFTTYVPDEIAVKYLPLSNIGFDKEGFPVRYFDFGNMDSKGILKCVKGSACIKTIVKMLEEDVLLMKKMSEETGKLIDRWVYIFNFENYSFAKATHKTSLETFVALFMTYEANYPERLKAAYIINASVYFNIAFQIIKPLLSGATIKKVCIYGKDCWKEDLRKVVDPEVLPGFLGGQRTDPDGNSLCNTFVKHGVLVPEKLFVTKNVQRLKGQPGVQTLKVSRMSKTNIVLNVTETGSRLQWEFETECRDIGFGLFYKDFDNNNSKTVELIPKQRIDTHFNSEVGMFKCDKPGAYILTFDNSYSWIFQKDIYYKAEVISKEKTICSDD